MENGKFKVGDWVVSTVSQQATRSKIVVGQVYKVIRLDDADYPILETDSSEDYYGWADVYFGTYIFN